MILEIIRSSWDFFLEVSPYLLLGFLVAGVLYVLLGEEIIKRHLGSGRSSVVKSALLGVPLPVCSCGVIPIAASLKRQGASKASVISFLYSTPVTGLDSILATYALLGPVFAVFRPIAAFVGGVLIGLGVYKKDGSPVLTESATPRRKSILDGLHHAFLYMPGEIGKWIIYGVLLGGIITVLLPSNIGVYLSNPYLAYPLMLAISIPLYVCATGSIPIAAALILKGLNPGAALAFLIAGPATNTVTITFVFKELGKKIAAIYLLGIALSATIFGILLDMTAKYVNLRIPHILNGTMAKNTTIETVSAIILLGLILIAWARKRFKKERKIEMNLKLKIANMSCEGCVYTIENRLKRLEGVRNVKVTLRNREVLVDGEVPTETVVNAIEDVGYEVEGIEELN